MEIHAFFFLHCAEDAKKGEDFTLQDVPEHSGFFWGGSHPVHTRTKFNYSIFPSTVFVVGFFPPPRRFGKRNFFYIPEDEPAISFLKICKPHMRTPCIVLFLLLLLLLLLLLYPICTCTYEALLQIWIRYRGRKKEGRIPLCEAKGAWRMCSVLSRPPSFPPPLPPSLNMHKLQHPTLTLLSQFSHHAEILALKGEASFLDAF